LRLRNPLRVVALLLAVLFCVICLAVGGIFILLSFHSIRDARYPTTVAKITYSSETWSVSGKSWSGGPIYGRMIGYRFAVGSQFYQDQAFPYTSSEAALSNFTSGETVLVGYNPHRPDTSFLEPVPFPWPWLTLGAVFVSAGAYSSYRITKRFHRTAQGKLVLVG
jgi:Protein of unknown function (DUF3592)